MTLLERWSYYFGPIILVYIFLWLYDTAKFFFRALVILMNIFLLSNILVSILPWPYYTAEYFRVAQYTGEYFTMALLYW